MLLRPLLELISLPWRQNKSRHKGEKNSKERNICVGVQHPAPAPLGVLGEQRRPQPSPSWGAAAAAVAPVWVAGDVPTPAAACTGAGARPVPPGPEQGASPWGPAAGCCVPGCPGTSPPVGGWSPVWLLTSRGARGNVLAGLEASEEAALL